MTILFLILIEHCKYVMSRLNHIDHAWTDRENNLFENETRKYLFKHKPNAFYLPKRKF